MIATVSHILFFYSQGRMLATLALPTLTRHRPAGRRPIALAKLASWDLLVARAMPRAPSPSSWS